MNSKKLTTSPFKRIIKLGGTLGYLGASKLNEKAMKLFNSDIAYEIYKKKALIRNAKHLVRTLGNLKGGAMKIAQMLSLHEDLFPAEVTNILSMLQKKAPSVSFEQIDAQIKKELKNNYKQFKDIDPVAYAAASIGQVHKAELLDGTSVVIKVQYPDIDKVIKADLKNLKFIIDALFSLFIKIDTKLIVEELKERLLEELDYNKEAQNMKKAQKLYENFSYIKIPKVINELSSRRILTMKFTEGISHQQVQFNDYSQDLKNHWGQVLFEFLLKGLFEYKYLHVDPNFSNFAFLDDGKVIVYDFGCTKNVPQTLALGIAKIIFSMSDKTYEKIPEILYDMGIHMDNGNLISESLINTYVQLFKDLFNTDPTYTFGQDNNFYKKIFKVGKSTLSESINIVYPKDIIFIDRNFSGHFGNLSKLKANAPWVDLMKKYASPYLD